MNFHELDNFNLADAVKFHSRLNPRIWGSDEHLLPEVREKLIAIAADFQEFLGVDDLKVQDITISGSNAAYSYTPHSDIDLHLVVDMPDNPVYQELFAAKKYQYNDEHDIKIAGVPVELYVQPAGQDHVSQGIYSIKNGDWIQVPQRRRAQVDDSCVQHKAADLDARIHSAVKSGDAAAVQRLWDKIKAMRQAGLEQNGEFGCENITFKLLRNMGCIGRLKDAKNALRDRELSLTVNPRERKQMNYGMRDYWFPGTAYAGQDHPAGTESEQVDESADPDQLKKILNRFYRSCVSKLELKNPPQLRLETTPDWSRENGSFGQYESETNTLVLATYGRHVLDILRTMAHEMTHRQQDEHEPLPIDAGETGSPWEDQANAMAGRIMRQWAEEQPEMFDGVTLEEASGYIPTKAQARDPRFVMALTKDVRPGAVGKEANKLGLQTDSQGHPALLTAGLNKLLREFKEQDLFEINMGGKNLRKEAAKTGALAGMEFEMIVPDTSSEDDELEPDFDSDERAYSPRDIREFFNDGDYNSRRDVERLLDRMMDDYGSWQVENFDTRWDSDSEQFIYQYLKENVDEDSIRELFGLEPEDDLTQKEYQLAADKIATEQLEPFYSDALDLSRDEYYENDNFEDWLAEEDIRTMSEIYHRYSGDITWPHYTSSLSGGTSVEDIADDFSQAVGRPAKASSGYHASSVERPAPGKNFYIVEPDGSLEPDGPGDSGLEFVSPPLPIDDIMSDLNKVKAWANRMGCYTNDSTGLHINISVPNYDLDKLDFVKLALLMGDEYVLQQFGRASNTYARSALGKVRDHVQKRPYEAKYLLDKMKGHMGALASKAIHSGSTEKYTSINTKDGHVEFRSPGGDWLDDNFDKIENTLMRFTVALSAAMDPAAYREEYLKKLYKILAPKNEKDPLSIFAKYAAGELPAAALKSFVRQAQADRKAKKSGEDIVNGHRWRVSLKPELGGGEVEVIAADPIDAKKQAIQQTPDWRFVDAAALTVTRLDEPAAGASATASHPEGRGRPNDPTGRYAITRRDDQRNYGNHVGSEAPDYQFRFTLPDGYSQAQMRSVLSAWAARNAVNAEDYMIVDTTQFAAPASEAPAGSGSVQWNIVADDGETVHTFYNRNVQADANQAALVWLRNQQLANRGPFDVVPAAIPGSTIDLQRQRQRDAALAAASMAADAEHAANRRAPTPIPGVQDIEIDIPMAQTQWEVYDRSTNQPVFTMYAETQANAWRKGQEWVATAMQTDPTIDASNFSVRQSTAPVTEGKVKLYTDPDYFGAEIDNSGFDSLPVIDIPTHKLVGFEPDDKMTQPKSRANVKKIVAGLKKGDKLPPILVRKHNRGYQVLDGHHRFWAYKLLGIKSIPARMVPDKDIEEIGKQGVTESQEITKLGKLDSVLEQCINMIHRGHETDPEKYGRVAACLIDNNNNHTYAINLPGPDGTRRHAERVAIDKHLERHGRIGPNAIMVTTLSPCVNHMSERYGESCTDLLSDYGIEKCYAGWQDPTQHPAEDYPFNLEITNNADIFNTCQHIAASFLPQNMADNLNETVWEQDDSDVKSHDFMAGHCHVMALALKQLHPDWQIRAHIGYDDDEADDTEYRVDHVYTVAPDGTAYDCRGKFDNEQQLVGPDATGGVDTQYVNFGPEEIKQAMLRGELKRFSKKDLDNAMQVGKQVVTEEVNPDCFDPAFNDTQHFDGLTYRASAIEENGKEYFQIKVLDDNFQQVGLAKFRPSKRGLVSAITSFKPEYQGQGIARNIYAYVRMLGNTIVPSRNQLPPGRAMWAAWKKSGDAQHLMKDVAENFADGKHPEDKGDSKRHHVPTKSSVSNLRKFAKSHSGRAAQLAHWMANMKSGKKKAS